MSSSPGPGPGTTTQLVQWRTSARRARRRLVGRLRHGVETVQLGIYLRFLSVDRVIALAPAGRGR